ncbi:MAG TPA: hypothetical protein PLQ88_26205, partial [Blastocatellia bacterium]|nr:hypothetical protein [Blastocatellia bacterium]
MTYRFPTLLTLFVALTALAACTATPERESVSSAPPMASVETFLPSEVRNIFQRSCQSCHGPDNQGLAGIAPGILQRSNRNAEDWMKYFNESPNESLDAATRSHPGGRL